MIILETVFNWLWFPSSWICKNLGLQTRGSLIYSDSKPPEYADKLWLYLRRSSVYYDSRPAEYVEIWDPRRRDLCLQWFQASWVCRQTMMMLETVFSLAKMHLSCTVLAQVVRDIYPGWTTGWTLWSCQPSLNYIAFSRNLLGFALYNLSHVVWCLSLNIYSKQQIIV